MNPPTADDLADFLGLPIADQRCEICIEAAAVWVEDRRCATDPVDLWTSASVNLGCLQYAGLLYQSKSAPTGLPEYEELQAAVYGNSMAGIYRLVGGPDVVFA